MDNYYKAIIVLLIFILWNIYLIMRGPTQEEIIEAFGPIPPGVNPPTKTSS